MTEQEKRVEKFKTELGRSKDKATHKIKRCKSFILSHIEHIEKSTENIKCFQFCEIENLKKEINEVTALRQVINEQQEVLFSISQLELNLN